MPTFNTTDPKPGYVYDQATDTWFPLLGIAPASQVDRWTKTAAGGETSLSGNDDNAVSLSYTAGTEQVYLNGVLLVRGQDYTATNGTTITGLTALAASDVAEVVTFNPSNIITTDAVISTDFEAKGDIISASAASTPIRVPVGTNGYVLKANSATTSGLEWSAADDADAIQNSIMDATGDIIYASAADTPARLALGTAGQVLKVNSGATAPEWAVDPTTDIVTTAGDLIYGTGADAVARLGIGSAGQVLKVNSGATAPEWGSSGLNWTQRNDAVVTGGISTIAYNGTNLYVAAGASGYLITSTDGITWTSRTSGFGGNTINKVAYGNGLWVAVGQNGTLTTSSDGTTWTARTANMSTNTIRNVIYANSLWVAIGDGGGSTNTGGITYSSDGLTWTRKSQSLTVGSFYFGIIWNGTNFVIAANNSTNNYLYASTPSGTWTPGADGSGASNEQLFWDGTRHIFVTSSGNASYSTSVTIGSVTGIDSASMSNSIGRNLYYDGRIYTLGVAFTNWSTTLVNNTVTDYKVEGFLPTNTFGSNGSTFSTGANTGLITENGYIVAGGQGRLWTSF